jgi:preprotein translocase subunit SecD
MGNLKLRILLCTGLFIVATGLSSCDVIFPAEKTVITFEVVPGTRYSEDMLNEAAETILQRLDDLGINDAEVSVIQGTAIRVEIPADYQVAASGTLDSLATPGLLEFVDFSMVAAGSIPEGACILTTEQVMIAESLLPEGDEPKPYDEYTCPGATPSDPGEPALLNNGQPFLTIMTGAGLEDAAAQAYGTTGSQFVVSFVLNEDGDRVDAFIDHVANNPNTAMVIVLDGRLLSAPMIQAGLSDAARAGTMDGGVITGNFTQDEARILAAQLKFGALPLPLQIVDIER